MRVTGINRIAIGVSNIDEGIRHYGTLLNTTFEQVPDRFSGSFGSHVAISWEACIELVAPVTGPAGDTVGMLPKTLGLMGIIFDVDDVASAVEHSRSCGVPVARQLTLPPETMNEVFGERVTHFEEAALDVEHSGVPIIFANIDVTPLDGE